MRGLLAGTVVLGCALALPSHALEYGGALGFRYDRLDAWTPEARRTEPHLLLDADLTLRGFVASPGVLKWLGNVRYEGSRASDGTTDSTSDNLTYRLSLAALERRNSPLTVSGSAIRSRTDFATEAPSGSSDTGVTTTESYDLGLTLGAGSRPGLWVRGLHRTSSNSGLGGPTITESADQVAAGMSHGAGPYNLAGNYSGTWNEGDLPNANYVFHSFGLSGTANFRPKATAVATVNNRQRIPVTTDPLNPTTESNSVFTSLDWLGVANRVTSSYSYFHDLAEAPGLEARESIQHAVTTGVERTFSSRWSGGATAGAQLARARLGVTEELSMGQSLSAFARWTGTVRQGHDLLVEAGPKVGLLEPAGGGLEVGHGASARARLAGQPRWARYALDYLLDYESDLGGRDGWALRQQLTASVDGLRRGDFRFRAYLTASGQRQTVRPFGSTATRNLTATGTAAYRRYTFSLDLALSDGAQRGLADSFLGDGLFLPASYDTHSRSVAVSGGAVFRRRLALHGILRYATTSGGGIPTRREASAVGRLSYALGRFRLSLEDRYVAGGSDSFDLRTNTVFVTLTRVFAGRL